MSERGILKSDEKEQISPGEFYGFLPMFGGDNT